MSLKMAQKRELFTAPRCTLDLELLAGEARHLGPQGGPGEAHAQAQATNARHQPHTAPRQPQKTLKRDYLEILNAPFCFNLTTPPHMYSAHRARCARH